MGGAADSPQRSSSPLKRRASDLEAEDPSTDDIDMIQVPTSEPAESASTSDQAINVRAASVDMIKAESTEDASAAGGLLAGDGNPATKSTTETDIPSIDAQISTITTIVEASAQEDPREGDTTFLVSQRWLNRVTSRGSEALKNSKAEPEGETGPIDNSDIIQQVIKDHSGDEFVQLRRGLGQADFNYFPQSAWDLILEWYGLMPGSIPITRVAHNTSPDKGPNAIPNIQYELYPPVFTIHRLHAENNDILISPKMKVSNPDAPKFVLSTSTKYHDFLLRVKQAADIAPTKKVRVWRVPRLQPATEPVTALGSTTTPPYSRPASPASGNPGTQGQRQPQDSWVKLFLDVPAFLELEKGSQRELLDAPDHSANPKYNGSMDLAMAGLAADENIVLDEHVSNESFVSNHVSKRGKFGSTGVSRTGGSTSYTGPSSQTNSGRNSPAPSGPVTRGRTQKSGRERGTVGLSNLGNTCYMNSALQCVRSVPELTKYFLTGRANEELNAENPLGNHGEVALAYERLLEEIYNKEPVPSSVAPRNFKNTIGRFAPSFSGYGQQDSQEFLGFLLDGLQEDLSRIKKKPYIEKPDSTDEMVNNPEAIREMAAKVWDITKKRDDSVIADLFTGMYKSTLVCPFCEKVSITFDPFNNLTLQLPIEIPWSHMVTYFPLNGRPYMISVDIDKNASIATMKEFISKRVGVEVERLFAGEVFRFKFFKIYQDFNVASEQISSGDHPYVYEIEKRPSNWPPRKVKKQKAKSGFDDSEEDNVPSWDDPMAASMVVPVFHRRYVNAQNRYNHAKWELSAEPHFIVLTPAEARSEEMIKRKILEKVATYTTHSAFEEDESDATFTDGADADTVVTTGSDADSSGDSKVVAHSIDGEDGLVDVTMKDRTEVSKTPFSPAKHRPKFVTDPSSYLEPSLQNMFELCYFSSSNELVPSGWNIADSEKKFPTLASRNPREQQQDDESVNDHEGTGSRAGSETSEESSRLTVPTSNTRMTEESSDEDDNNGSAPLHRDLPVRPAAPRPGGRVGPNKRRTRGMKTYSRKGNHSGRKVREPSTSDQDALDGGPLVRLGEAIFVDWNDSAWDAMFQAEDDDTLRGLPTWTNLDTLDDPELDAARTLRSQRRKRGISLDDCLDEFGKEEILSELDTWYCPRCKEHRRASKKFELWKTPDILVMHLKRFSSSGYRRDKLDVLVDFPIENLDLTSRVIERENGKQEVYDLFAVDDHWGGLGGGHYTAFAKNFIDNEWYEYNDASVSKQKDLARMISSSAYLLFYRRRSDVPLGGPRFKQIIQEFDNPQQPQEDDVSESGEDQGLAGNSSQRYRGSSSALTGVGAARQQQSRGSAEGGAKTINPAAITKLPDYQTHEDHDDAPPLLAADVAMNDGLLPSIEDEGIEMDGDTNDYKHSYDQTWNFANLNDLNQKSRGHVSGAGTDMDAASDIVQHDSSASEGSMAGRLQDFDHAIAENDDGPFVDQSPVPDLDEDAQMDHIGLQAGLFNSAHDHGSLKQYAGAAFDVTADDEHLEVEEPATEIHIPDNDELKME